MRLLVQELVHSANGPAVAALLLKGLVLNHLLLVLLDHFPVGFQTVEAALSEAAVVKLSQGTCGQVVPCSSHFKI